MASLDYRFPFPDRAMAGRALAQRLQQEPVRWQQPHAVVLALPRGGVPVAAEVAQALQLPLDVMLVRKLGTPGYAELGMGAVASGDVVLRDEAVIAGHHISEADWLREVEQERQELKRREHAYRGDRPPLSLADKRILLIDDGVATGFSMRAAVAALRQQRPEHIAIAVPVAPRDSVVALETAADAVYCLETPEPFYAIGQWYLDFHQLTDAEVCRYLQASLAG